MSTMVSFRSLVLLILARLFSCSADCVIDNRSRDLSWEVKLHRDLLSRPGLRNSDPPSSNNSVPNPVTIKFILKFFKYSDNEEVFTIKSFVDASWIDERLSWKPEDYGGIKRVTMSSLKLWTPTIWHFNALEPDHLTFFYCLCNVDYNGKVRCAPKMRHETVCQTQLRNWPYDIQNCTLHFGDRTFRGYNVRYIFGGITMIGAEYGAGWTIIDYNVKENCSDRAQISLTFVLERESELLEAFIVTPSILISVLTLTSLVLDVDGNRLFLSGFSLFLHFGILQIISGAIPRHSNDPPAILLFVRTSILLTLVSILFTLKLHKMQNWERLVPLWVLSVNNYVLNSRFKYMILPRWALKADLSLTEDLDDSRKSKEDWLDFANILNSSILVVFLIAYSVFFSVYMPRYTPYINNDLK